MTWKGCPQFFQFFFSEDIFSMSGKNGHFIYVRDIFLYQENTFYFKDFYLNFRYIFSISGTFFLCQGHLFYVKGHSFYVTDIFSISGALSMSGTFFLCQGHRFFVIVIIIKVVQSCSEKRSAAGIMKKYR